MLYSVWQFDAKTTAKNTEFTCDNLHLWMYFKHFSQPKYTLVTRDDMKATSLDFNRATLYSGEIPLNR